MHNIKNLFYFEAAVYIFRTVSPSIIRSLRLYIQHQVYAIQVLWLLASGNEMELLSMHSVSNLFYFGTTLYMFRTVSPSIIRSIRLYIRVQHQVYVLQFLWLLQLSGICLTGSVAASSSPRTSKTYT
jgi:hypothetical protein